MNFDINLIWKAIISVAGFIFIVLQIREKMTKHQKEIDDAMLALSRALNHKEMVDAHNDAASVKNKEIDLAKHRLPMLENRKMLIEDAVNALSNNQHKLTHSFDTNFKDAILYSWRLYDSIQDNLKQEKNKEKWPVAAINDEARRAKMKIDSYRYLPEDEKQKLRADLTSDLLNKTNRIKEMVDQDILITKEASEKQYTEELPDVDTSKEKLDLKRAQEWWWPRSYTIIERDR